MCLLWSHTSSAQQYKVTRMCRRLMAPASPCRRKHPYHWWEFWSKKCQIEVKLVLCVCLNILCSCKSCCRLWPQPFKVLVKLWVVAAVSHCAPQGGSEADCCHGVLEAVAWPVWRSSWTQFPYHQRLAAPVGLEGLKGRGWASQWGWECVLGE